MISFELAKTPKLSRLKRRAFLTEALYWRAEGNKKMKNLMLNASGMEKINQRYFIGTDLPF